MGGRGGASGKRSSGGGVAASKSSEEKAKNKQSEGTKTVKETKKTAEKAKAAKQLTPTATDLEKASPGTTYVSEKGTSYVKQRGDIYTVTTKNGLTMSGLSSQRLADKIKKGKVKLDKKTTTNKKDGFGNYRYN